ncbi:MAG: N-acetylmuramic acid 6-phosphate etherase [Candidatus Dadabacteria bacterium]|nr:N-acetylmuramic acid 6-phosphate etherase [Candidatus Dadabacteria bacterium]NIS07635.1 N-acetylmuramic acid 6-phosphate etherase [Candidatus Dadabacteria bacterium]NIV42089.1 N-acetylmuramic acid 6-phosphate etherase [Candidatus Dadabacteria bacterium]NIX16494.1 N-acetylmuramic acid 6-phosphate etherase [Candidatus Dadabacteria bacterium]NIY21273.1 N-acetylmuramic acid 6-phosphate etherase [Candidatus Dadabacteria bacterium]
MKKTRKTDKLVTESVNPDTVDIDISSTGRIIKLISDEDRKISKAVYESRESIEAAVELIYERAGEGGRIFFVGAGTSGRLGVIEAAECPPTFGTSPAFVQAIIAGGKRAVFNSIEGAEDCYTDSIKQLKNKRLSQNDVVVGIAASSSTPFVIGAIDYAKEVKAPTVLITFNPAKKNTADIIISPILGPEVIVGSTRMKSGTATKMILNMLTTAIMIKLGKTYKNLMVDVQPKSEKLRSRAKRIVRQLTGATDKKAQSLLLTSNWQVKPAVVMGVKKITYKEAKELLRRHRGFLRKALE